MGVVWPAIAAAARRAKRPLRVLDLATGSGDVPLGLWRRARRFGIVKDILGLDISPQAVEVARKRADSAGAGTAVTFATLDVMSDPLPQDFDAILASLFLHHLDEPQAVGLLAKMAAAARHLVLVNDLVRSRGNLILVALGARLLTTSGVVHTDASLSVRAAFTVTGTADAGPRRRIARCKDYAPFSLSHVAGVEESMMPNSQDDRIAATLSWDETAREPWDAVIAGAGPAGAVCAYLLARRGHSVLLVDKSDFPRSKVCGSCLNGAALSALAVVGLGELPARLGGVPLHAIQLQTAHCHATLPLPVGLAVSRCAFDAALVRAALAAGAAFLPRTTATLDPVTVNSAASCPHSIQLSRRRAIDECLSPHRRGG